MDKVKEFVKEYKENLLDRLVYNDFLKGRLYQAMCELTKKYFDVEIDDKDTNIEKFGFAPEILLKKIDFARLDKIAEEQGRRGVSIRIENALESERIETYGDLLTFKYGAGRTKSPLRKIRNFGAKSNRVLLEHLKELNLDRIYGNPDEATRIYNMLP